mmetsp:Transcript_43382/g.135932  ORF Transcript_43382/g.135932 Transcript_43382/m.135932 type:complete len:202 (-) Transcript_43382:575-1180(-)
MLMRLRVGGPGQGRRLSASPRTLPRTRSAKVRFSSAKASKNSVFSDAAPVESTAKSSEAVLATSSSSLSASGSAALGAGLSARGGGLMPVPPVLRSAMMSSMSTNGGSGGPVPPYCSGSISGSTSSMSSGAQSSLRLKILILDSVSGSRNGRTPRQTMGKTRGTLTMKSVPKRSGNSFWSMAAICCTSRRKSRVTWVSAMP